jgi:putative membrane protein
MRRFLVKCLVNALAFYIAAALIPHVSVTGVQAVFLAGAGLGLIHLLVRPLFLLAALPVNLFTLGIFTVIIDTWLVMLLDRLASGIAISGFWEALLTALIISALNGLTRDAFKK